MRQNTVYLDENKMMNSRVFKDFKWGNKQNVPLQKSDQVRTLITSCHLTFNNDKHNIRSKATWTKLTLMFRAFCFKLKGSINIFSVDFVTDTDSNNYAFVYKNSSEL